MPPKQEPRPDRCVGTCTNGAGFRYSIATPRSRAVFHRVTSIAYRGYAVKGFAESHGSHPPASFAASSTLCIASVFASQKSMAFAVKLSLRSLRDSDLFT